MLLLTDFLSQMTALQISAAFQAVNLVLLVVIAFRVRTRRGRTRYVTIQSTPDEVGAGAPEVLVPASIPPQHRAAWKAQMQRRWEMNNVSAR